MADESSEKDSREPEDSSSPTPETSEGSTPTEPTTEGLNTPESVLEPAYRPLFGETLRRSNPTWFEVQQGRAELERQRAEAWQVVESILERLLTTRAGDQPQEQAGSIPTPADRLDESSISLSDILAADPDVALEHRRTQRSLLAAIATQAAYATTADELYRLTEAYMNLPDPRTEAGPPLFSDDEDSAAGV